MSWSLHSSGKKAVVIEAVNNHTISETFPEVERVEYAKVKELIISALEKTPDDDNVTVQALGSSSWNGTDVLSSTVSLKLDITKPTSA